MVIANYMSKVGLKVVIGTVDRLERVLCPLTGIIAACDFSVSSGSGPYGDSVGSSSRHSSWFSRVFWLHWLVKLVLFDVAHIPCKGSSWTTLTFLQLDDSYSNGASEHSSPTTVEIPP